MRYASTAAKIVVLAAIPRARDNVETANTAGRLSSERRPYRRSARRVSIVRRERIDSLRLGTVGRFKPIRVVSLESKRSITVVSLSNELESRVSHESSVPSREFARLTSHAP